MFKQSYKKAKKKLSDETLQEIMLILEREDLSLSTKAKQIKELMDFYSYRIEWLQLNELPEFLQKELQKRK